MRPFATSLLPSLMFALIALGLVPGSGSAAAPIRQPDQLVILSTTDVKGKTSPCGCHIPKGGLARQASFVDSIRATYDQVLWVDNGGFFPEDNARDDVAAFLMDAMKTLNLDAVGVGERDLRFGVRYLRAQLERTQIPMVSANLVDARTRRPVVQRSLLKQVGSVKVGLFSLIGEKANLGPAKDSLAVLPPEEVAGQVVAELRKKGAHVVVLLSQLGKIESEDLVAKVAGIDAVIAGHNVPLLQKGRVIEKTVACYGGEQGQYMCRTTLSLDPKRRVITGDASAVMLSQEVGEKPEVARLVKAFEDSFTSRARKAALEASKTAGDGSTPAVTPAPAPEAPSQNP
jgi:2',3'-cyclic-nucleotide 2'-phosphodiesterase (5'-nucleotidase family)